MATLDGITVTGRYNAERTVMVIGHRLRHTELAAPRIFRLLEFHYKIEFNKGFGRYRGFLIDTGALQESLTQPDGANAIRERHFGIEFGTSLYYARFHSGYLLHMPKWVDDQISEIVADTLVPEERLGVKVRPKGNISGYFRPQLTSEGVRDVWVRPHVRGGDS